MVNEVTTKGIVRERSKSSDRSKWQILKDFHGSTSRVVRPVSHGFIALIEVETISVDLFNVIFRRTHIFITSNFHHTTNLETHNIISP